MNDAFLIVHRRASSSRVVVRIGAIQTIVDDFDGKATIWLGDGDTVSAEETLDQVMGTLSKLADDGGTYRTVT